jgi:hypothetical protein
MNKQLPYEILRNIGLFLSQIYQRECSLVCKTWQKPFQTLVFQKAVFLNENQFQLYQSQDASLRKLTISMHFNVPLTDELFEQIAQASPHVNTLTLYVNLLNNLSITKTVSVIRTYWLKSLTKIRMDELLLPEIIPLLSHQLENVSGGFGAFFDSNKKLISMPQLKVLDIEQEEDLEYATQIDVKRLNDIRLAYPKLQDLTISYFRLDPIQDNTFTYTPFPFVRSFHLLNCDDTEDCYPQLKNMFTDLKQFSFLRINVPQHVKWAPNPYLDLVTENPNLNDVNLLYLGGISQREKGFPVLSKLSKLTACHLERSIGTDIITKRELLDFDLLISSAAKLKKLRIVGLFHATSGEPFDNYLRGTVGFCDSGNLDTPYIRDGNTISITNYFVNQDETDDFTNFGDGEELYKSKDKITTVKKRTPVLTHADSFDFYEWWETKPFISRPLTFTNVTYPLTTLRLESVTLRNPTYLWIAHHLPCLEELYVFETEPYPYFEIVLGDRVHTFQITFDARFTQYGLPIVHLDDISFDKYRTVKWNDADEMFDTIEGKLKEYIGTNAYAIHITFRLEQILNLCVCHKSMMKALCDMHVAE